jgi:hypothetical protein
MEQNCDDYRDITFNVICPCSKDILDICKHSISASSLKRWWIPTNLCDSMCSKILKFITTVETSALTFKLLLLLHLSSSGLSRYPSAVDGLPILLLCITKCDSMHLARKLSPMFSQIGFVLMDLLGVFSQVSSVFNIKYLLLPRLSIFNF